MSDNPTPEEVRASIVPKSDQLNADDLVTGPITVTVTKVSRGDTQQPIVVEIEGYQPYKPCKTMRRVMIATWSDDAKSWVGKQMTLFCDPDVLYKRVRVGGIRISHLSELDKPKTFVLTKKRGNREEVTIYPVETLSPENVAYIEEVKTEIENAETTETLKAIGFLLRRKSPTVQNAVRPFYAQKLESLTEGKKG